MYCTECGNANETDALFCIECGNTLKLPRGTPQVNTIATSHPSWYLPPVTTAPPQQNSPSLSGTQPQTISNDGGFFSLEKKGINMGVWGGVLMLVIAGVWFFGALAMGIVFFYPPILALFGVYAIIKGLATGNFTGNAGKK
jgi:hypothetical protein